MADESYTNVLGALPPLTVESIEKATREIEPIAAEIRQLDAEIARASANAALAFQHRVIDSGLLGFHWDWRTDDSLAAAHMRAIERYMAATSWDDDRAHLQAFADFEKHILPQLPDPSRYPHVCPRCSGPAYIGAVEVDCARGCTKP